jgi:hypothetical protein
MDAGPFLLLMLFWLLNGGRIPRYPGRNDRRDNRQDYQNHDCDFSQICFLCASLEKRTADFPNKKTVCPTN